MCMCVSCVCVCLYFLPNSQEHRHKNKDTFFLCCAAGENQGRFHQSSYIHFSKTFMGQLERWITGAFFTSFWHKILRSKPKTLSVALTFTVYWVSNKANLDSLFKLNSEHMFACPYVRVSALWCFLFFFFSLGRWISKWLLGPSQIS